MTLDLTPDQARRLAALRTAARLLDSAFTIPGTRRRIGLDPIMGLIPVLGDLVSPIFSAAVLWQARDLGVPRIVQLRMIVNVALDVILGTIPLLGDLFDFGWKSNERNFALLERHAFERRRAAVSDWLVVMAFLTALGAIMVAPFVLMGWMVNVLTGS